MRAVRLITPVALLLLCSGMCALVFQVGWLREFRLIFGGSTPASAAVVAIFMAGLGAGNALLGKYADRARQPLALYAALELCIGLSAASSPFLIDGIRWLYVQSGGQSSLGAVNATLLRLGLATLVLGLPTFLMGGTLPAAVAAVTTAADKTRRGVGVLYGMNTFGAVAGAFLSTFVLLQFLGTRQTLWFAAGVNLAVSACAFALSKRDVKIPTEKSRSTDDEGLAPLDPSHAYSKKKAARDSRDRRQTKRGKKKHRKRDELPSLEPALARPPAQAIYLAAGVVGFAFMLMELVWFRMLAPILGGTTFTFGLILGVALFGIGIGGVLYPLLFRRKVPTLELVAITCALEAAFIAIPYALGDRLAIYAAVLHQENTHGFLGEVMNWSKVSAIVLLPASIVSGVQFPLLIALLGSGDKDVGKQVGRVFASNTFGGILGSLAGGFGLLPLLTALGTWKAVVVLLAILSLGLVVTVRRKFHFQSPQTLAIAAAVLAVLAVGFSGPTAVWLHSGIGVGRSELPAVRTPNAMHAWENLRRRNIVWEADGVEASVGIGSTDGLAFWINGKSDGNAIGDAGTQIMLGMLGALLHPNPKQCLVIGLGTGESAGWLAEVESVGRVDVVEIEPALDEMARRCAPVNQDVLRHPKVRRIYNDAREVLLTTPDRFDLIVSEPSNPYRAGIANLFTREFYESVRQRLEPKGLFVQWLQGYEIDALTVHTAFATLSTVFPYVEIWHSKETDMLLVCSMEPPEHDAEALRKRLKTEPFRSAVKTAWRAIALEGVLAHFVAGPRLVTHISEAKQSPVNTDDWNQIEYGFARTLGQGTTGFEVHDLRTQAIELGADRPFGDDDGIDWERVTAERMGMAVLASTAPTGPFTSAEQAQRAKALEHILLGKFDQAVSLWESQPRQPGDPTETSVLALAYSETGNSKALPLIEQLRDFNPLEALILEGILLCRQGRGDEATVALSKAFRGLRTEPWTLHGQRGLETAVELAEQDPRRAATFLESMAQPFAVGYADTYRLMAGCLIAAQLGPEAVLPWCEQFEPHVPWRHSYLALRAEVYRALSHPLSARAEQDLMQYRQDEARTR